MASSVEGDDEVLLRTALDALALGIFIKDSEGRYLFANAAYRSLIRRDECTGRTDAELGVRELGDPVSGGQPRIAEHSFSAPGRGPCTVGFAHGSVEAAPPSRLGEPSVERRMLARLLHDSVAQHLTGLMLRAEAFNQSLLQAVEDVRRLTAALSPARLEDGLLPALRSLCGPETVLEVSGSEDELETSMQTLVCDVLQEQALCCPWPASLITLAVRSSAVEVRLTYENAKFDPECALHLEARALGLGGHFERARTEHHQSLTLRFPRRG